MSSVGDTTEQEAKHAGLALSAEASRQLSFVFAGPGPEAEPRPASQHYSPRAEVL